MKTAIRLPYNQFAQLTNLEIEGIEEVEVSLGCAEFAKRDIPEDAGFFPVHLSLKMPNGRFMGCGAYPGMVYGFDQSEIEALWGAVGEVIDEDTLYSQFGVNSGEWLDDNGDPVCADCLSADGSWHDPDSSEYNPESDDYDPGAPEASKPNPVEGQVCWSCKQMLLESMWEQSQRKEWAI